ncbi:MAG: radical SAM protein [Candidatus Riflebacteria bacterium]|nr:radical SAM protein [Candidatus Riflebacteria bacterium]
MKINKVMFIIPPLISFSDGNDINPVPPLGLGYLASNLQNHGFNVRILDCLVEGFYAKEIISSEKVRIGLRFEDIVKKINGYKPDMVGISCQFSCQHDNYKSFSNYVKQNFPDCILVAGGAHATVCTEELFWNSGLDFILRSEADRSLISLIKTINSQMSFSEVDGLCWKMDGKVIINQKKLWIENLDCLPFPSFKTMNLKKYRGLSSSHGLRKKQSFSPIITSRGCPATCTFCSANQVWGKKYRFRSVENVIEEMRILKDQFGIEEILFEDDNLTANPKRAKALFRAMIRENFNFAWDTPNGVGIWTIDNEMIDLMKESGCYRLNFPIESASKRVLNCLIKKPLDINKAKQSLEYCKKIGLDTGIFLVAGFPGETPEELWKSFKFSLECKVYFPHISYAVPYPGTEMKKICEEKNYIVGSPGFENLHTGNFYIQTPFMKRKQFFKTIRIAKNYMRIRHLYSFYYPPGKILIWMLKKLGIFMRNYFSFNIETRH